MPYRRSLIVQGEIYHVFNRSIARQPIFLNSTYLQRGLDLMQYYAYSKPPLRFSHYNRLPQEQKSAYFDNLKTHGKKDIEFYAFCDVDHKSLCSMMNKSDGEVKQLSI